MLNPVQQQRYIERFAEIESSFRLEGMDPSGDAIYEEAKGQVLSGEMTANEALDYVLEESKKLAHKDLVSR